MVEGRWQLQIATQESAIEKRVWLSQKVSSAMSCSTPVKLMESGRHVSLGVTHEETPVKLVSNVDGELDVNLVARVRPVTLSRPHLWSSCETMASVEGASADIGLSDTDTVIGQGNSAGQSGPIGFSSRNIIVELSPEKNQQQRKCFLKGQSITLVNRRRLC